MFLYNLQKKIFELLDGNVEIKSICNVYDYIPEDKEPPFIVIGEDRATPWNTKTWKGKEITTTIHVWSIKKGSLQTKQLLGLIEETLSTDFNVDSYFYEFKEAESISVERESIELVHGIIEIQYRVKREV